MSDARRTVGEVLSVKIKLQKGTCTPTYTNNGKVSVLCVCGWLYDGGKYRGCMLSVSKGGERRKCTETPETARSGACAVTRRRAAAVDGVPVRYINGLPSMYT